MGIPGEVRVPRRAPPAALLALFPLAFAACATTSGSVSPSEIPALERRLTANPLDVETRFRYAAALFASGDCDGARSNAERALQARPGSEVGTLIVGQCFEREERFDEAVSTYRRYVDAHPNARGIDAVRAREAIAARSRARALVRQALLREDSLAAETDAEAMGVLPFFVTGDEALRPLSLGLAHIMVTDLSMLDRFRLVERVDLAAVLNELQLSRSDRVDPATAARVGRLLGAGRLMQGSLVAGAGAPVDLGVTVALRTGDLVEPDPKSGELEGLLRLQKQMVLDVAGNLGYVLSEAERQRILESGPRSLIAFLAFSRGLEAEERGDYAEAARHYAEAAQADPSFTEAGTRQRTAEAIEIVVASGPAEITALVEAVAPAVPEEVVSPPVGSPLGNALTSSVIDVAGTQAERATQGDDPVGGGGQQRIDDVNRPTLPPLPRLLAIIRVIVTIP